MKRVAFKMQLKPGVASEYHRRHDEIWPELARVLDDAGIRDYSIFLEVSTGQLFALQTQTDPAKAAALPMNPVVRKWWAHMAPLMVVNSDNSPVITPLHEVFHLPGSSRCASP